MVVDDMSCEPFWQILTKKKEPKDNKQWDWTTIAILYCHGSALRKTEDARTWFTLMFTSILSGNQLLTRKVVFPSPVWIHQRLVTWFHQFKWVYWNKTTRAADIFTLHSENKSTIHLNRQQVLNQIFLCVLSDIFNLLLLQLVWCKLAELAGHLSSIHGCVFNLGWHYGGLFSDYQLHSDHHCDHHQDHDQHSYCLVKTDYIIFLSQFSNIDNIENDY